MPLNRHQEHGFSLLEVLIAVVVVSVGFLATARMQIEGMRSSQNAYFVSQANFMLREMTDRMRANNDGVADGFYQNVETSSATDWPTCMTAQTQCSAQQVAQADLATWSRHLHPPPSAVGFIPLLPSSAAIEAAGRVDFDAGTNTYTVSVQWSERMGKEDTVQTLSVQVFP